jgi:uncharacterized membrane protein YbjE (DUF340 family)
MFEIIALMMAGMALGFLIRKKQLLVSILEKGIVWSIFLLLFLLGLSIGTNEQLMAELPLLGGRALLLSLGGISGSLLLAFLAWRFLFRRGRDMP